MSETLYDGFEKTGKKQNKEQVPPAAEPQIKKPLSNKQPKKSNSSNTVTSTTYKSLEEAFKAVSTIFTQIFLIDCLQSLKGFSLWFFNFK